ncbi:four helix bundle protein [Flavobacteriaceae bacterium TP-CH-4]|uniref:Four helix bundle protein n=1 Tax=Pelagihabitans pacificus TaxID=2696054 RepID=A0A967ASE9_9FLAO|nr:four helix bundle protein [Pelagihabitans pacificus]NHF59423.1 four helix bundle protein [Pelagihabitans pacificus]
MGRHNFKKLKIWEEGMSIVDETYVVTKKFPDFERYHLISQLIMCSVSIPSNIAEVTRKSCYKHFNKYIEDSLGSAFEWETQLNVAYRQKYIDEEKFEILENRIQQLQRMISGFQDGLNR